MAPTLRIIRDLMAPHGVIFIHINDIELPRLLLLMEEIFDEKNKIGLITWKSTVDNNPARVSIDSEYILVWARSLESVASSWRGPVADAKRALLEEASRLRGTGEKIDATRKQWESFLKSNKEALGSYAANYRFLDDEGRAYMMSDVSWPGGGGPTYDVLHPATGKPCRLPSGGWRYQEDTMSELIDEGRIIFGLDETTLPYYKRYLDDDLTGKLPDVLLNFPGRASFAEMTKLFPENPRIFKNPKPVALEDYLLSFVAAKDAIVLDAFAGSGTTGHAVMRLNSRDKGTRRFILIEEGNAGDEYATSLTAERLRRARVKEGIPGGFSFLRVGEAINFDAFEKLQREHLIQSILQTDASGRGGGIKPVKGAKWVIGHNARREAICLHYDAKKHTPITAAILKEIYAEIDKLGLNRPVRVYGESSEIFRSESFTFFKLPDEVANNLTVSLRGGR
jgi:adenine-specific DNA-methyltransferase